MRIQSPQSGHLPLLCRSLIALAVSSGVSGQTGFTSLGKVTREGVSIELSAKPVDSSKPAGRMREQQDYILQFSVTDSSSGEPLRGTSLAAWMDRLSSADPPDPGYCKNRIHSLLGGNVFSRAEVDLNAYHVLVMNRDATITVVDPLFGFGNSKLLSLIPLKAPGEDWALTSDQDRLFVSQPDAKALAVVDAVSWKVLRQIDTQGRPSIVRLQPDERYVWIAVRAGEPALSGVFVVDRSDLTVAAMIHTGPDPGDLAFSPDGPYAFVADRSLSIVSVIDVRTRAMLATVPLSASATGIAFSPLSQMAYVTTADGSVTILDATRREPVKTIRLEPGIRDLRFAPGGRWGLVVNPEKNLLSILDASSNRVVQTGTLDHGPSRVYFTANLAFIERRDSEIVLMLPLTEIGKENQPFSPADFPGGQHAFGDMKAASPADRIVPVPGENAVLVANPADKTIYFYEEGMAAPQGQFSNYGHEGKAVIVVDHSLRQHAPGMFQTTVRVRQSGDYLVPLALASPSIGMCLVTNVAPNPEMVGKQPKVSAARVEPLMDHQVHRAGEEIVLRFRLIDPATGTAFVNGRDVRVLTMLSPGLYQNRAPAVAEPPDRYSSRFTPSEQGRWLVFVESLSRGLTFNNSNAFGIEVEEPRPKEAK